MTHFINSGGLSARRSIVAPLVTVTCLVLGLAACGTSGSSGGSAASGSGGSASGPSFSTISNGVLTVATYGSTPPVTIDNSDGSLGGLEGSLLTDFAQANHLKIKVVETTFASMILAVQQHRADVATFIYYTPKRAKQLYYTSPFMYEPAVVITKKGSADTTPESLQGKRVGTVVGFVWASYLQKSSGKLFQSQSNAAQALLSGQIDGYVNGGVQIYNPPLSPDKVTATPLKEGDFGMPAEVIGNTSYNAVSCDNKALAQAMDAHFEKMRASGAWAKAFESLPANFVPKETVAPQQGC